MNGQLSLLDGVMRAILSVQQQLERDPTKGIRRAKWEEAKLKIGFKNAAAVVAMTAASFVAAPASAGSHGGVDFSGKTWRDPIVVGGNLIEIAPKEKQIYIYPLYAVSTLMQTEHPDKNLAFAQRMFRKIYDGTASMTWPDAWPGRCRRVSRRYRATSSKTSRRRCRPAWAASTS